MSIKKTIRLTDDAIEAVLKYKRERGLSSWTAAVNEILCNGPSVDEQKELIAKEISQLIKEQLKKDFDGIRISSRATEHNTRIVIRGIDTVIAAMGLKDDAYPKPEESDVMTKIKDEVRAESERNYQIQHSKALRRSARPAPEDNANKEKTVDGTHTETAGRIEGDTLDWLDNFT